ncbi:MAG: RsmD family RNA methyltransferase [[Clostridium] leptum]
MGIFPYQEKAMRVITGSARGRRLQTLEGQEVRPTPERIKEAVFSIIQFEIEGRRFLDLFAGSGQMGIEALSRGAREAVFVDSRKDSVQIIRENLEKTGLSRQGRVVNMDSLAFLSSPTANSTWRFRSSLPDGAAGKGFGNDVCGGEARRGDFV